jgi:copper chaperone CopZ
MKRVLVLSIVCAFVIAGTAYAGSDEADQKLVEGQARVIIPVTGMTCGGCCVPVEKTVKTLDGVVSAKADYEKGLATVVYVEDEITVKQIVEAINTTKFKATMPENEDS